jgi:3-dehydroquinate dehydratase-2
MITVQLLNGPNLNLLGQRESAVYGSATLAEVGRIQEAQTYGTGVVMTADACADTLVAPGSANAGSGVPTAEAHRSNRHSRAGFRHRSPIAAQSLSVIRGFGPMYHLLGLDAVHRAMAERAAHTNPSKH